MISPGRMLKNARESQGISLKEVAESTKILQRYLEGLEEENYEYLPSKVYIRGYLQSYARFLKIDPEEILRYMPEDYLRSEYRQTLPPIQKKRSSKSKKRVRLNFVHYTALGALLSALGIGLIVWIGSHGEGTKLAELRSRVSAPFIKAKQHDFRRENLTPTSTQNQPEARSKPAEANENPPHAIPSQDSVLSSHIASRPSSVPQKIRDLRGDTAAPESRTGEMVAERSNTLSPTPRAVFVHGGENEPGSSASTQRKAHSPADLLQQPILLDPITSPRIRSASAVTAQQGIIIDKYCICTGVKDRAPQDNRLVFSTKDERVYTWMRVKNAIPPTLIRHIYYFGGEKVEDIALNIPYSSMRTWSYKTINHTFWVGKWRVDIVTKDGKVLESIEFQVAP